MESKKTTTLSFRIEDDLKEKLLSIVELKKCSQQSMQKVFDEAFNEISEARKYRSWQRITDCLNENTLCNLTVLTVKTMYKRFKKTE